MGRVATAMLSLFVTAAWLSIAAQAAAAYPVFPTSDAAEEFFGERVADPFRGLEDVAARPVREFVDRENAVTARWIPQPAESAYRSRLRELMDYPKRSVPERRGPWWLTRRNTGLQPHSVLFKQRGADGRAEVLIDPNTFSPDGTVALTDTAFTEDGALVAYGKSVGGSDDQTIYVREVATGADRPDVLRDMRFSSIAWARDNSGFWYNKFPDPARRADSTIYWHRLGDPQEKDRAVFAMPKDPEIDLEPVVTEDGKYLVVHATRGTDEKNGLWLR